MVEARKALRVMALAVGLAATGAAISGCGSTRNALGLTKVTPDEFRVVAKAPLTVPPDFALRPPAPGEPRPQELQPESQARLALLGQRAAENRTEGEKELVAKAGAEKADPLIRYVMDDEFGSLAHKDKSFSDKVLGYSKGQPVKAADGTALDPAAEQAKIQALTGRQPVVISRGGGTRTKLPGL